MQKLVRDIDLQLLGALPFPRQNDDLRQWFFPKDIGYYEKNPRKRAYASADPKIFAAYDKRDTMNRVLKTETGAFAHRRQAFSRTSTTSNISISTVIFSSEGADLRVWAWETLKRQVNIGTAIVKKLFHHIFFWYEPLYEPGRNQR